MSAREPRFEIVRTDAGWHARFVAANGQTVWTTESYTRRRAAVRAVSVICGQTVTAYRDTLEVPHTSGNYGLLEVREVEA